MKTKIDRGKDAHLFKAVEVLSQYGSTRESAMG
jgi:hypothetical protein